MSSNETPSDTFDTYSDVFQSWPYIAVRPHDAFGRVLVLGQLSGSNSKGEQVRRTCSVDRQDFRDLAAPLEFHRHGRRDAQYAIKVLPFSARRLVKFWTHVADPARRPGDRDILALYRWLDVSPSGVRELDRQAFGKLLVDVPAESEAFATRLVRECRGPLRRPAEDILEDILGELEAAVDTRDFEDIRLVGHALIHLAPHLREQNKARLPCPSRRTER